MREWCYEGTDGHATVGYKSGSWFPDGSIDDYFGANVFGV
jgi:hypothetical protein